MKKIGSDSAGSVRQTALFTVGAILIVLVTIDIYIRVLSPDGLDFISAQGSSSLESNENLQKQRLTTPPDDLLQLKVHDSVFGTVFRDMEALEDMGDIGDAAWDSLMFPPGGGYLYLKSNETTQPAEPWGVSMFHSLHCVFMLRSTIQGHLNERAGNSTRREALYPRFNLHVSKAHYQHCIAYLAQGAMCAADGTIEAPLINYYANGTFKEYIVNGIGIWHQCKDKSILWKKVLDSEAESFVHWNHTEGDTVQSLWGWT